MHYTCPSSPRPVVRHHLNRQKSAIQIMFFGRMGRLEAASEVHRSFATPHNFLAMYGFRRSEMAFLRNVHHVNPESAHPSSCSLCSYIQYCGSCCHVYRCFCLG